MIRPASLWFPALVLLAAAALRFYGLDRLSLWADELWVVQGSVGSENLGALLAWIGEHDNHPPAYYLLLRFVQQTLGNSDFLLRLPSAIAGVLLVAATWHCGERCFSRRAGALAAVLVAGSYPAIYYSQEARPNIFAALFAIVALDAFLGVWRQATLWRIAAFAGAAALAAYFHYAGAVFCACLALCGAAIAVQRRDRALAVRLLAMFALVAVLYLPWSGSVWHHLVATPVTAWQRPPTPATLWVTFRFLFGPDDLRVAFATVVLVAAVVALSRTSGETRTALAVLLAMIVLPPAVFYVKSVFSQDAYNHRHFLYAIPLLALLAGQVLDAGLGRLREARRPFAFAALVLLLFAVQLVDNQSCALYTANHFKQEFRETAQVVAADTRFLRRRDTLLVSNTPFFDHYLKRFLAPPRTSAFVFDWTGKADPLDTLLRGQAVGEFYYLEAPIVPGANRMVTAEDLALLERYTLLCRTRFARAQAWRFSTLPPAVPADVSTAPDCRSPSP